jgi:hypothetical protein
MKTARDNHEARPVSMGNWALAIALVVVATFAGCRDNQTDAMIESMHNSIHLGDTEAMTRATIKNQPAGQFILHESPGLWVVLGSYRFGAIDWCLWIGFNESKVTGVAVRISDGKGMRPNNAPPDKGTMPPDFYQN